MLRLQIWMYLTVFMQPGHPAPGSHRAAQGRPGGWGRGPRGRTRAKRRAQRGPRESKRPGGGPQKSWGVSPTASARLHAAHGGAWTPVAGSVIFAVVFFKGLRHFRRALFDGLRHFCSGPVRAQRFRRDRGVHAASPSTFCRACCNSKF